jgi:DNA adenine methylase
LVEPFFGGASVALHLAEQYPHLNIVLIDKNPAIAHFWQYLVYTDRLAHEIEQYQPTVNDFYERKEKTDPLSVLIVNRCSHSGRGGGPIGGKSQEGRWKIDARWDRARLGETARRIHAMLRGRTTVIAGDGIAYLDNHASYYCDPPYFSAGDQLYHCSFSAADHQRLAAALSRCDSWLLSYDDHPEVRKLYGDYEILPLRVTAAKHSGGSQQQKECLILNL